MKTLKFALLFLLLFLLPVLVLTYVSSKENFKKSILGINTSSSTSIGVVELDQTKLKQMRIDCSENISFHGCICSEIQSSEASVHSISMEDKLKAILMPALSKAEFDTLSTDKFGFGGYTLIDSLSYSTPEQVRVQSDVLLENSSIKPFMALDAEGGVVQRFSWYQFETLRSMKNLPEEEFCIEVNSQAGELKKAGFNMVLAPVIDMAPSDDYWIYSRTIDSDPTITADVASRYLKCMRGNNILTTTKHFPGHGSTKLDSHKTVPVSGISKESWNKYDSVPFKELVNNGVPFVMTGHLVFENINPEIATLSSFWMNNVLREELGYENLIITDDLMMLRPEDTFECAKLVAKSINNGGDIALFVHNAKCNSAEVVKVILDNDMITEETINDRFENVLRVKKEYLCE